MSIGRGRRMKKNHKRFPKFKKEIKDFLLSEEGKITKKDIAKVGMSLAILSLMFPPSQAAAHISQISNLNERGQHSSHSSHASHASHGSHGNHCQTYHQASW